MCQILNAAQSPLKFLNASWQLCLLAVSFLFDALDGVGPLSLGALLSHSGSSRIQWFHSWSGS